MVNDAFRVIRVIEWLYRISEEIPGGKYKLVMLTAYIRRHLRFLKSPFFILEREGDQVDNVVFSTLAVENLKLKNGEGFEQIKSDNDFMTVLVKLKSIGVEYSNSREFFDTAKSILEYICRTGNGKLALLHNKTLQIIRINSNLTVLERKLTL